MLHLSENIMHDACNIMINACEDANEWLDFIFDATSRFNGKVFWTKFPISEENICMQWCMFDENFSFQRESYFVTLPVLVGKLWMEFSILAKNLCMQWCMFYENFSFQWEISIMKLPVLEGKLWMKFFVSTKNVCMQWCMFEENFSFQREREREFFCETSYFGSKSLYAYRNVYDWKDFVFETSRFDGNAMHEMMCAMHVGMQMGNWFF